MTTYDGLLRGTLENPEDRDRPLILADWLREYGPWTWERVSELVVLNPDVAGLRILASLWLEDNGQKERAEFIRLQLAMQNWDHLRECRVGSSDSHSAMLEEMANVDPVREHLQRREQELLKRNRRKWLMQDAPAGASFWKNGIDQGWQFSHPEYLGGKLFSAVRCFFRHGFVEEVSLSVGLYVGHPCHLCYYSSASRPCENCHGKGYLPGVAGDIFRAAPVRSVNLFGSPHQTPGGRAVWLCLDGSQSSLDAPNSLPRELFDLLPNPSSHDSRMWTSLRDFPTPQDARIALVNAAVLLGRRRAWPCQCCAATGQVSKRDQGFYLPCPVCQGRCHTVGVLS